MGCVTCSSGRGNSNVPAGCNNNGSCGTGGCNKLNVFDWLADIHLPGAQAAFDIVEIRFKNSRKEFFKNTANLQLKVGDIVAVEASPGHDIGIVALTGELVRLQLKKNNVKDDEQFKTIYRIAKQTDIEKWHKAIEREKATMMRSRTIALELKLVMKISDVEFQGDGSKATFFYTADDRVDFRELIKIMAEEFRVRIEMRQIGARQEAARLGGIGSCGRELCCSTWLKDFRSVNTSAARYQQLSLNPQKLAGQCGKLKCCLNYELDSYLDAIKDFPDTSINLESKKGRAFHQKTDIFKRQIWYAYTSEPSNFIALDVDRVKQILEFNKKGEFPDDLKDFEKMIVQEKKPDYENVVGQDSLTRFDQKRNKKKKKKKRNPDQRKENSTNA
jgi:cell fate regulator YaaT (PSP1 superfamily)